MSMTREQAIEILGDAIVEAYALIRDRCCDQKDEDEAKQEYEQQCQALTILAPEPRTEPPGVEEVGDGYGEGNEAWAYDPYMKQWTLRRGEVIRMQWGQFCTMWLPYSALPMPKATDGTATFEKGEG